MQLWTEYEGLTIEGAFSLKKLLLPEGRSAFFSTANGNGEPVLVRLIECHFDEEEILARWRSLGALGHPNFLRLEQFGKLVLDDGPVVYAVFEKADANLADVLERGPLNKEDVLQLAASVAAALEVLHTHGFVHEHMEAGNVFAVGEVVKLRVDCIREAPEGAAGATAKQRDVHGLATLLLQAITQKRTLEEAAKESPLPAPFDQIVRYGITGTWGLTEIRAALERGGRPRAAVPAPQPARPHAVVPKDAPAAAMSQEKASQVRTSHENKKEESGEKPIDPPGGARKEPLPRGIEGNAPLSSRPDTKNSRVTSAEAEPARFGQQALDFDRLPAISSPQPRREREDFSLRARWIGAAVLLLVVCFAIGWLYARLHRGPGAAPQAASNLRHNPLPPSGRNRTAANASPAPAARNHPGARNEQAPAMPRQWRVVAYTYDHADQARKKAAELAGKYPGLRPEVFSPRGRAPYLVTLGGVMRKNDALALTQKLRRSGLPRDTYAQNFHVSR